MLYYLPGCHTIRNHPAAGKAMQEYMKMHGAKIAKCCKFELDYLEPGDTVVQNCTQCDFILKERRPDIKVKSLYEFVLEDPHFPWADLHETITVQDCFRMRNNAAVQNAVRECLVKMHITCVELEKNRADTTFCGVWLMNPADPECQALAPEAFAGLEAYRTILTPEEQEQRMREWASQYTTKEVAVYCNGCENGLRLGGAKPVHMIELLAAGM